MVLKTFNLEEEAYRKFSEFCKGHGLSMSKQINIFIESQMEEEPEVKKEYLKKLELIQKGKGTRFRNVAELRAHIENV
jgi:hypothetical protein